MVARLRESRPDGGTRVKSEEREFDPETGRVTVRRQKKRRTGDAKIGLLKDPRWFRFLRKATYIGVPSMAALMIVVYMVLVGSVGANRFQEGVGRSLASQFGLPEPVDIKETALSGGVNLSVGKARMRGDDNSMLQSVSAEGIVMRLGLRSFLGGPWRAQYCTVRQAAVVLGPPSPAKTTAFSQARPLVAAGFLLSDEPKSIDFSEFSIWNATVLFGGTDPVKTPGLRNVRVAFSRRHPAGGQPYFDGQFSGGREGELTLPGWPAFRVETIRLAVHPDKARIVRSILHLGDDEVNKVKAGVSSFIEARGEIPFAAGMPTEIDLSVRGVFLSDLLPKGVTRFCNGIMRSEDLRLTYTSDNPAASWRLQGAVALDAARLRSLPIINQIMNLTGGELAGVDFDECRFDLDQSPAGISLSNIDAVTDGRMRVMGNLKVGGDGKLEGKLRLGLASELLLQSIPPFFTQGDDGFYWADVALGGQAALPSDDLTARLQAWTAGSGQAMQREGAPTRELERLEELDDMGREEERGQRGGNARDEEQLENLFESLIEGQGEKPKQP